METQRKREKYIYEEKVTHTKTCPCWFKSHASLLVVDMTPSPFFVLIAWSKYFAIHEKLIDSMLHLIISSLEIYFSMLEVITKVLVFFCLFFYEWMLLWWQMFWSCDLFFSGFSTLHFVILVFFLAFFVFFFWLFFFVFKNFVTRLHLFWWRLKLLHVMFQLLVYHEEINFSMPTKYLSHPIFDWSV